MMGGLLVGERPFEGVCRLGFQPVCGVDL